jgi:hypothetical protein
MSQEREITGDRISHVERQGLECMCMGFPVSLQRKEIEATLESPQRLRERTTQSADTNTTPIYRAKWV